MAKYVQTQSQQQWRGSRWSMTRYLVAGVAAVIPLLLGAFFLFGAQIRSLFAWQALGSFGTKVFAVAAAPDGALWMAIEGKPTPGMLGIDLLRQMDGEKSTVELPADNEFPGPGSAYDGFSNPIRSMVVDHLNQVWLLFGDSNRIAKWDGTAWRSFPITAFGGPVGVAELAELEPEVWGFSATHHIGFKIDSATDRVDIFEFRTPGEPIETALHITAFDLQPTVNGGLVITGATDGGGHGIIHLPLDRPDIEMSSLNGDVDLPDGSWSLDFGTADAEDNLYAFFTSPNSCREGRYSIRVGIQQRATHEWTTYVLRRDLDCSEIQSLASFAVDPQGRIWVALSAGSASGVQVFESPVGRAEPGEILRPILVYTVNNSSYTGDPIHMARSGLIYTLERRGGRAVAIDSGVVELPAPAPSAAAVLWERPDLLLGAFVAAVLLGIIYSARSSRLQLAEPAGARFGKRTETDELIFRQTRRQRRISLLTASLVFALLLAIVVLIPASSGISIGDAADIMPDWFLALLWGMPVIYWAVMGYWVLFAWEDRLVITPELIERRGLRHFSVYRGPVRFDQVTAVRRGRRGVVVIERGVGRRFEFTPKAYGSDPDRILRLLREIMPAGVFERDLSRHLYERSAIDLRPVAFLLAGAFLFLFSSFSDDLLDWLRRDLAWATEEAAERDESIDDFALSQDGSLWLLVQRRIGAGRDPRYYQVRHVESTGTEVLEFPSLEVLYPRGLPENGGEFPIGISILRGELRVYFFLVEKALIWTSNGWEWEQFPEPLQTDDRAEPATQEGSGRYWLDLLEKRGFEALVPSTGQRVVVTFGQGGSLPVILPERESYGWSVARFRALDSRLFMIGFREDPADSTWVEVELQDLPERDYWGVADVATGPDGSIYVLMRSDESCGSGIATAWVGRLGNDADRQWVWRALRYPQDCERAGRADEIVADAHGRVLIQDWDRIAIFEPSVFADPEPEAQAVTLYTEENSGFQSSHRLVVGPDDRIWSLDKLGHALVWLDPNAKQLPKPLPEWTTDVLGDFRATTAMQVAGLALYIAAAVGLGNQGRKRRSEKDRAGEKGPQQN